MTLGDNQQQSAAEQNRGLHDIRRDSAKAAGGGKFTD